MTTPLHVACYADLRAWFRRRRRAILITAGAVGAGCLLYYGFTRYASIPPAAGSPASSSTRVRAEEEARLAHEDFIRRHYEEIQLLADSELSNALAHFKESLFRLIDISEITRQLLAGKEGPQALNLAEKMQLWQKVKIQSFTRALVAAWGMGLLHLFIRMQLNVLGRRMFISTALEEQLPPRSQHGFMAVSDYFSQHGYQLLAADVEHAVNQVLGDVSLKTPYSFDQLRDLFIRVQALFENHRGDWSRYLLPEGEKVDVEGSDEQVGEQGDSPTTSTAVVKEESTSFEGDEDDKQDELIAELRGVISSPEFNEAVVATLDTLLDFMMQEILPQFHDQPAVGLPLAKLVPAVSSKGTLLERPEYDKYIRAVAELPPVKSLCLLVYGNPGP